MHYQQCDPSFQVLTVKGGHLDFSHLTKLKKIYIYHRNLFEKTIQLIYN